METHFSPYVLLSLWSRELLVDPDLDRMSLTALSYLFLRGGISCGPLRKGADRPPFLLVCII